MVYRYFYGGTKSLSGGFPTRHHRGKECSVSTDLKVHVKRIRSQSLTLKVLTGAVTVGKVHEIFFFFTLEL